TITSPDLGSTTSCDVTGTSFDTGKIQPSYTSTTPTINSCMLPSSAIDLSKPNTFSASPVVTVTTSNIIIAWQQGTTSTNDAHIFIRALCPSALVGNVDLNPAGNRAWQPAITSNGDNAYVAWTDYDGSKWQLYSRPVYNNGASLGPLVNLGVVTGDGTPSIAASGNYVFLTSQMYKDGHYDAYL